MKRIGLGIAAIGLIGLLLFAVAGCAPNQVFVEQVDRTANLIDPKLRDYVRKDAALSDAEKDDWYKILDSFRRLIDAAKEKKED